MRNLSMKKFGTPMRAGPGVASEKVGLAAFGEPSAFSPGTAPATSLTLSFARPAPARTLESARLTGFSSACTGAAVEPFPPPEGEEPEPLPPPPPRWLPGVAIGLGTWTCGTLTGRTVGVAIGVGVATGPRSRMLLIGAGRPLICAGDT